jgi:CarD family transcriptional regulator
MTFQIGEKVVYPNQGVGTIENISVRSFGSQMERFYLLRLAYNSLTVMIPFTQASQIGLRKVTRAAEVAKVLDLLAKGRCKCAADWKVRFKENMDKMTSGRLLEVAEVFKVLVCIQSEKPLSFREKKQLDRARQLLIGEVSAARALSEADAIELMGKALGKSNLKFPEAL